MTRPDRQGRDPLTVAALALAVVAFLGSFSHVQEVVNAHGQHGWISFAIACMPEVSVVLFVLKVRRARRTGEATVWAWIVGTSAAAFTVSANLATAEHSPWGYVVAAWPAWASIGAAGLIEMGGDPAGGQHDQDRDHAGHDQGENPAEGDRPNDAGATPATATMPPAAPTPAPAPIPAPAAVAAGQPATTRPAARPAAGGAGAGKPVPAAAGRSTGPSSTPRPGGRPTPGVSEADVLAAGVSAQQLAAGRQVAADLAARGQALTRAGLVAGIRELQVSIGTGPGGHLLALLKTETVTTPAGAAGDVDQAPDHASQQTSGSAGMAGVVDLASHHHPRPTDRPGDQPDPDNGPDHDHHEQDDDEREDDLRDLVHVNANQHPDHHSGHDGLLATIGGTR